jgi:hypothetical protein
MNSLRLFFCCYFYALTSSVWAGPQSDPNTEADRADVANHKTEKMAGRANYANGTAGATNKEASPKYPLYTQEARAKKPMSKEEKQALRRQINETESKYPKR